MHTVKAEWTVIKAETKTCIDGLSVLISGVQRVTAKGIMESMEVPILTP